MAEPAAIPVRRVMACASKTSGARSISEFNGFLGSSTNNVAEYNGLLAALRYAQEHGHRVVHIKSDSELLVKQMRGEYRVKNAGLQPLYHQARAIAQGLDRIVYEHVRREQNKDADRLANLAMDEGTGTRVLGIRIRRSSRTSCIARLSDHAIRAVDP